MAGGTPSSKPDFAPLLPAGIRHLSLDELRALTVEAFPLSTSRSGLFQSVGDLVGKLQALTVEGELWVDGSFLTEKIDPADADVVYCGSGLFYDAASPEQRAAIDGISRALGATGLDAYRFFEWPPGHALHADGAQVRAYWEQLFGHGRDGSLKGIASIVLRYAQP